MICLEKTPVAYLERWFSGYELTYGRVNQVSNLRTFYVRPPHRITGGMHIGPMFCFKPTMPSIGTTMVWRGGDPIADVREDASGMA